MSWPYRKLSSGNPTSGRRLSAETEVGFVAPHAMQNDGELAGDGRAGARHSATLADLQATFRFFDKVMTRLLAKGVRSP